MYYVYTITLSKGEIYVGCTSDIKRRQHQHNENIRKRKNRFATYIADNYPTFFLKFSDFTIIATFEDRKEALKYERKTAKSYIGKTILLNDNYNLDCSRIGKNLGNTAKNYFLIDTVLHTETQISDLRQYCLKNNLDYKLIQRTVKGNKIAYQRYKVFYECDWLDVENKEYYLSGQFYIDNIENHKQHIIDTYGKRYLVRTPSGEIVEVVNLNRFAREHNLSDGTLHSTLSLDKSTKGYKVIKRIDN